MGWRCWIETQLVIILPLNLINKAKSSRTSFMNPSDIHQDFRLVRGCVQWTFFELIRRVLDSSFIWKKLNILLNWLVGIIFNISHLNIFLMNLCPVIRNQIFFVLTGNSEAHTKYQVFVDRSHLTLTSNYLVFTWVEQWLYSFEDVLVAQSTFSGLTRVFVI